ncbi:electron transport complex subunit RsxG [Plasticicumulans acidivorans]|uniref:Ion-translocating oxidoreductase complex subunit G n=1 Tax=Plasticicumulans acidivorans TaxID=886464 RepID=A0A317MRV7_9GAMM|nr:electron transport complex subunit RsxG [Plasticicumulans acidivorans]PWV58610.1 electron transport complex protein RnfG [Plasticicumulans acidivorans]
MSALDAIRARLLWQAGSLAVVAAVATAALLGASHATQADIEAAAARDLAESLAQVLPTGFANNDLLKDVVTVPGADGKPLTVWRARKDGKIVGVIYRVSGTGYAGAIRLVMAVDPDGRVLGVRVVEHHETPGLGDKIERSRTDWIEGFNGHSLGDPGVDRWAVKKDGGIYDQFTGATITPRGVVKAVRSGLELFAHERGHLISDEG